MSKTISFFDKDFDNTSFEVPDKLDITNKFNALLWLYDQMNFRYISMYEGEDPYGWFNDAVEEARDVVYQHLKAQYLIEKDANQ